MGCSEWAVLLTSKEGTRQVLAAVAEHNRPGPEEEEEVGEELDVTCVLRFQGRLWMCLSNGGGRSYTSLFLHSRLPRHTIFWPFGKPEDWLDCQDYVWRNGKPGFAHLDELAAALPLPEDTPTDPLPFELVPIPPPESDTRDDAIQAWLASLPGLMSSASTASVSGDVRM
ncbi:hypothetical protein ABPG77_003649 [Micractinium sp. CCAP 211/92]